MIDSGTINGSGAPDLNPVVNAILGVIEAAGGKKPCTPKTTIVTPGSLSWRVYRQDTTGAIAFEWIGPGSAAVSDDCAGGLNITVQLTDQAPGGNPQSQEGDPGHGSTGAASDDGFFRAAASSSAFVVYYDLSHAYQRGSSVIDLKVTGTYYNPKAKAWLPIPCKETRTAITPYPTGPQGQTGPVQDCAA